MTAPRTIWLLALLALCAAPCFAQSTRPTTRPSLSPEWVLSIPWCAGDDNDPRTPLALSYGLNEGKFDHVDGYVQRWVDAGGRRIFIPCPYGRQGNVYRFDQRRRIDAHPKLKDTPLARSFPEWRAKWESQGVRFTIQTGSFATSPDLSTQEVLYELATFAGADLAVDSSILSGSQSFDYGLALTWRGKFLVERPDFKGDGAAVAHWRRFDKLCVETQFTDAGWLAEHDPAFTGEYLVLQETNLDDPLRFLSDLRRAKKKAALKGTVTAAFRMEATAELIEALGIRGN